MPPESAPSQPPLSPEDHLKAVQSLYLRNQAALKGLILGILPDLNRAEDVLQDVFFVITEKASDFELGTNFMAWAMRIAKYRILELHRADRAKGTSLSPDLVETLIQTYQPNDQHDEMLDALHTCTECLSPSARQLLTLRYHGRLKPAQIAKDRGLAVETVYSVLSKTRSALRKCVEQKINPTGGEG